MALQLRGGYAALALHDVEQSLGPNQQARLGRIENRPGPDASLLGATLTGTNLGARPVLVKMLALTAATDEVLAAETAPPDQIPGSLLRPNLGKKPFRRECFVKHANPPEGLESGYQVSAQHALR